MSRKELCDERLEVITRMYSLLGPISHLTNKEQQELVHVRDWSYKGYSCLTCSCAHTNLTDRVPIMRKPTKVINFSIYDYNLKVINQ